MAIAAGDWAIGQACPKFPKRVALRGRIARVVGKQGVFKAVDFANSVSVNPALPFVRASVDGGMALG